MQKIELGTGAFSAERLKQEAALRMLMILAPPFLSEQIKKGLAKPTKPEFNAWLVRFEDTLASRWGAIAEALGESFAAKFGPDLHTEETP